MADENPLMDWKDKLTKLSNWVANIDTPTGKKAGSSTDPGKLPPAWEEANRKSLEQQMGRKKLTADGPTLGGKKKTTKKTRKATARKKE